MQNTTGGASLLASTSMITVSERESTAGQTREHTALVARYPRP